MTLGRTTGGKIQIKQDPLRAVNCACCGGECYQIKIPEEYDVIFQGAGLIIPGYCPTLDGETCVVFSDLVEDTGDGWETGSSVTFIDEPDGNLLFVYAKYIISSKTFFFGVEILTSEAYGFLDLGGLECCDPPEGCSLIDLNIIIGENALTYDAIFYAFEGDPINAFTIEFE